MNRQRKSGAFILLANRTDSSLRLMTIHKEGETTVGRTGQEYKKHWTYSVPSPNSSR